MFTLHQLSPVYLRARSVCRSATLSIYRAPRENFQSPLVGRRRVSVRLARHGWLLYLRLCLFRLLERLKTTEFSCFKRR
jgi:hypothetical protein